MSVEEDPYGPAWGFTIPEGPNADQAEADTFAWFAQRAGELGYTKVQVIRDVQTLQIYPVRLFLATGKTDAVGDDPGVVPPPPPTEPPPPDPEAPPPTPDADLAAAAARIATYAAGRGIGSALDTATWLSTLDAIARQKYSGGADANPPECWVIDSPHGTYLVRNDFRTNYQLYWPQLGAPLYDERPEAGHAAYQAFEWGWMSWDAGPGVFVHIEE